MQKIPLPRKLHSLAVFITVYRTEHRRLVGQLYIRKIQQGLELPKLSKKLFDQCWASLDYIKTGSAKRNHLSDLCDEFLTLSGFDVNIFPPSVSPKIRESVTREMEVVSKTYISLNMENKIRAYILKNLKNKSYFEDMDPNLQRREVERIFSLSTSREECSGNSCPIVSTIRGFCQVGASLEYWTSFAHQRGAPGGVVLTWRMSKTRGACFNVQLKK